MRTCTHNRQVDRLPASVALGHAGKMSVSRETALVALADDAETSRVEVYHGTPDFVVLVFGDGSRGGYRWNGRDWEPCPQFNPVPGGVGAMDGL